MDSRATQHLLELFEEINNKNQTIIMVTHSAMAASYAKRVLFMKDGVIFHQIYRGDMTIGQMNQKISDTLAVLSNGGEIFG